MKDTVMAITVRTGIDSVPLITAKRVFYTVTDNGFTWVVQVGLKFPYKSVKVARIAGEKVCDLTCSALSSDCSKLALTMVDKKNYPDYEFTLLDLVGKSAVVSGKSLCRMVESGNKLFLFDPSAEMASYPYLVYPLWFKGRVVFMPPSDISLVRDGVLPADLLNGFNIPSSSNGHGLLQYRVGRRCFDVDSHAHRRIKDCFLPSFACKQLASKNGFTAGSSAPLSVSPSGQNRVCHNDNGTHIVHFGKRRIVLSNRYGSFSWFPKVYSPVKQRIACNPACSKKLTGDLNISGTYFHSTPMPYIKTHEGRIILVPYEFCHSSDRHPVCITGIVEIKHIDETLLPVRVDSDLFPSGYYLILRGVND